MKTSRGTKKDCGKPGSPNELQAGLSHKASSLQHDFPPLARFGPIAMSASAQLLQVQRTSNLPNPYHRAHCLIVSFSVRRPNIEPYYHQMAASFTWFYAFRVGSIPQNDGV